MARETSDFNKTPSGNRLHISFFGCRNAGKSSVVNSVTNQELSIVSNIKGTTTDPVKKAMELLPLGPVLIIDTPGIDDSGLVGEKRVLKTKQILNKTDVAILVVDYTVGIGSEDNILMDLFKEKSLPYIVVFNKADLNQKEKAGSTLPLGYPNILVSTLTGQGIEQLKELIGKVATPAENTKELIGDILNKDDLVVLVTPIDSSAPKGRMILPQVQTIRDILDANCCCLVTQTSGLKKVLENMIKPPALVVTDSQAFQSVKDIVPTTVPLTSFSILFARYKGILDIAACGAYALSDLNEKDYVLISEGCTHHRQCEDIGTIKLPSWIEKYTGKKLNFQFTSGGDFPEDLSKFSLVVHCGGCMLNQREMMYRMKCAQDQGVPFTNYGTLISHINGILKRSLEPFN